MKLKLHLTLVLFFVFISMPFVGHAQSCDGSPFVSPGAPATCTYTYTGSGWDTTPPTNIDASESVCILANNSTNFGTFKGTMYIAAGVTYTGNISSLNASSTVVVAGTATIGGNPSISGVTYIEPTGVYNANDTNFSPNGPFHVAGTLNTSNNMSLGGSTSIINYSYGTVNVQGDLTIAKPFKNCGLLEVIGDVNAGGSGTLINLCTLYVHNDLNLNNDLINDALLVIDGDMKFNGKDMVNNGTMLVDHITIDRDKLIGNNFSSILIVRNDALLVNGGIITDHYFFDLDNGGGFDYVCNSCTEDIILLESVTVPAVPGDITTDCGVNIVIEYPFCKTIENDNTIYGHVFNDFNRNGAYDLDEPVQSGVTVNLYEDLNFNGIIDGGEGIIQTDVTNTNGEYTFGITPIVNLNQVFSKRVDRSSDDAEQTERSRVALNSKNYNFELKTPFVGIRINDIPIPRGSRINSATISFFSNTDQAGLLSYEISGQDIDNAPTFEKIDNNISNRWDDSNKVPWFNMADWLADTVYSTTDISSIVQNNINRPGWESNNSMAFIFRYFLGTDTNREVVAYDDDTATAPLLEINYDATDPASYIVQIDASTLPGGYNITTPNSYVVPFTFVNEIDCDNDFGFASPCVDLSGTDTDGDGVNDGCDLDDDNDGILDVDECPDLGKPQILDGDFEYVNIVSSGLDDGPTDAATTSTGIWKGDASNYPNWESADPVNNDFEIWQNGNTSGSDIGGSAYSGIQWVELNASTDDGFYQDIVTTPGDLLQWSFAHRKRRENIGSGTEDIVDLLIGDPSGSMVSQGNFATANDASWTLHSGTYTVPVGQTTTRLRFTAINTIGSSGSGNHIDNVKFFVIPNCADTDGDTYPDYLDIDSDDDGIPDNIEAQATVGYVPPTGVVNAFNGLDTNYRAGLTLIDTDSDGIYDFQDSDSDADGSPDIEENGTLPDTAGLIDTDGDGLKDLFETNGVNDATWDVNEDIEDPTNLTILPDADDDRFLDGDLDYRDLLDTNSPELAKIDFDGVNDFIQFKDSPINYIDEFTLSFWMKLEETLTGGINDKTFVIGQKDMFEISVGNNSDGVGNPNVWATHFYGAGPSSQTSLVGVPINEENWLHITARVSYITEIVDLYLNGELVTTMDISGNPRLTNLNSFRVGSKRDLQPDPGQENFHGWIDEIRVFSSLLTTSQIQRMVYQEIENNVGVTHGVTIDRDIIDPASRAIVPWANLVCYLPMNKIQNSKVIDKSSYGNHGELFNILTIEPQDVPMPYVTKTGYVGDWTDEETWLSGDVWDIEDIANNKDWSIVQIKTDTNVTTTSSHTQLGMLIDSGGTLTVGDTGLDNQDFAINNTWYLKLDGTIDLQDDSQLIQGINSDLVTGADGKILRRQEGNLNYYWYNYWSSPVGAQADTINTNMPFKLDMIKDGAGLDIEFTSAVDEVGKISKEWLYTFQNGLTYYNWVEINENTSIAPGFGYTQKGTGNAGTEQQYIFEGKPNNGTILIAADDVDGDASGVGESVQDVSFTTSLIGNPYPSALDAEEFIRDNIDFDNAFANPIIQGTILLWEQWAGSSHYLNEYEGGYGYINLTETVRAYQHPDIIISDPTNPDNRGIKTPTKFIPVGQAFFVEVVNDGNIVFNNGQRVFKQEDLGETVFFRSSETTESASTEETAAETQILRLEFGVSSGASRSFVIGFTEDATDGYDYGMDGGLINDPPADDMGSLLNGQQYVIQAFAPITPGKEIDLVLHASGNFTYTLKSTEISNFPADQDLFLKDLLTGQNYDLRSTEPYNFVSVAGSFTDRFKVVFQDPAALSTEEFITDNTLIYVNQPENKLYVKQLDTQAKELNIINMLGQTIKTYDTINNQTLENGIDISGLSSGLYIVSIKTENDRSIDKKVIFN